MKNNSNLGTGFALGLAVALLPIGLAISMAVDSSDRRGVVEREAEAQVAALEVKAERLALDAERLEAEKAEALRKLAGAMEAGFSLADTQKQTLARLELTTEAFFGLAEHCIAEDVDPTPWARMLLD